MIDYCGTCNTGFDGALVPYCPVCRTGARKARRQVRAKKLTVQEIIDQYGILPRWVVNVAGVEGLEPPPRIRRRHKIPTGRRRRVFVRDQWKCVECGTDKNLTIDHVIPRSKGGSSNISNLQTLCEPCNQRKGDSMPEAVVAA